MPQRCLCTVANTLFLVQDRPIPDSDLAPARRATAGPPPRTGLPESLARVSLKSISACPLKLWSHLPGQGFWFKQVLGTRKQSLLLGVRRESVHTYIRGFAFISHFMAPKVDPNDPEVMRITELFAKISYTGSKALETSRNPKHVQAIEEAIVRNHLASLKLDSKRGQLVVTAATQSPADLGQKKRDYLIAKTAEGQLDNYDRVKTAIKYLISMPGDQVDGEAFRRECGVGVFVSPEQVQHIVQTFIVENKEQLEANGKPNIGLLLSKVRGLPELRWAAPLDIKNAADASLRQTWPPITAGAGASKATKPSASTSALVASTSELDPNAMFKEGLLSRLHKPGENPQLNPELRQWHLNATKGRVFTRFPPEPNGFLHIGHTKAIAINFGFARYHGGFCYLRYDDTNPEAEEGVYFDSIIETVRWLGFEPWKITYSSDYFQQLYELAVILIKKGKAYVDFSTPADIFDERGGEDRGPRKESKFRNRSIEENLRDFEDMKNGKHAKGTVTLRMKQDILGSGNPQMWDMIAYRVLDKPHHRTGDTWKIYPTYDFTHCLVDSFENISHSLCTTEFILSRESYEWLCDAVDVYKPRQYEFGRLNLEGTITSKRKIKQLVDGGYVKDWDDPRLFTVIAIRRRGVPPGAILSFVNSLGVSTSLSQIGSVRLDQSIRQHLETSTPRLMMLLDPIKVVLENVPDDWAIEIEKPLHPKVTDLGKNRIPFAKQLYIDSSDFRTQDSPDYFRLAPGKSVGLLQTPFPITCLSYESTTAADSQTRVSLIRVRYEDPAFGGQTLEKAQLKKLSYVQWVAEHAPSRSPVKISETRIFHPLFKVDNPAAEKDFLEHINPTSLEIYLGAMVEVGFWDVAKLSLVQVKAEVEGRTAEAAAKRLKLSKEGDDAIRTPPSTSPLKESGVEAPSAKPEQLYGFEDIRFQAMRLAYFTVDRETTVKLSELAAGNAVDGDIILNRIVSLKTAEEAKVIPVKR